jgi:hypothetical protein
MIDKQPVGMEAEKRVAKSRSWPDLLWAAVFGFSFSFFIHKLRMTTPVAVGLTIVVAQLVYLIIPAKRKEYGSFSRWARFTVTGAITASLSFYVLNRIFQ